jgi:hypothetical protein
MYSSERRRIQQQAPKSNRGLQFGRLFCAVLAMKMGWLLLEAAAAEGKRKKEEEEASYLEGKWNALIREGGKKERERERERERVKLEGEGGSKISEKLTAAIKTDSGPRVGAFSSTKAAEALWSATFICARVTFHVA